MDSPKPMKWWFHYEAQGTHLLFESFVMESGVSLFFGYVFIVAMCWSERAVTYYLDRPKPGEGAGRSAQWKSVILRTLLYGVATTLRLWYMLVTMYFNIGFFIVVVFALTSGQLVIEFLKTTRNSTVYHIPDPNNIHHRHSTSSSGYTSLEYKDTNTQNSNNAMHVVGSSSTGNSDHSNKRRSRHRDDIEEEQRLFAVPADHEEFELTHSAHHQ